MRYRAHLTWDCIVLDERCAPIELEVTPGHSIDLRFTLGEQLVQHFAECNLRFSEEFGCELNPSGPFVQASRLGVWLEPIPELEDELEQLTGGGAER
jgi:hypothetical protein